MTHKSRGQSSTQVEKGGSKGPQSKPFMSEIIENLRRSGSELNGVATYFNRRIFSLTS